MTPNHFNELSQQIDRGLLVATLKEMIALKSENPFDEAPREGYREQEMGDYLAEQMSALGMEVTVKEIAPGRPNVFGFLKGSGGGPTLMLAGHMDTARTDGYADAYRVREKGGRIYGRGACDMKAGLAAYLEVARLLKTAKIPLKGNLIIAGIADEEFQLLGSKDVGRNGPKATQGIIGEPTGLRVCPANKGRVSTFIRTIGKATHSSVPEEGRNAIVHMALVIQAFADFNDTLRQRPPHPLCGHGRFSPGVIQGGVQVNMVPDRCSLEVDRRTLPGETKAQVYAELHARLSPLKESVPGFRYEISDPSWFVPPNDISGDEPVVRSLLAAHRRVLKRQAAVSAFAAGSDAPHMGFPTVVCGPGAITQAHSNLEFVSIAQLAAAAAMYLWTTLDLLG